MKNFIQILILLIVTQPCYADETPGPHGGTVIENKTHKFEVKIDPDATHVDVYTLGTKKKPPKSMAITLFRDSGTGQTIELKAADPVDRFPRYQGVLGPNAGSYVGAELRFGVSLKSFQVLKFIPHISNRK